MLKLQTPIAGLALMVAVPATAQPNPILVEGGVPTASVSYADLDLSSPSGRARLEGRVARAASSLCAEDGRKPVEQETNERRCISTALAKARIDIDRAVANSGVRMASRSTITVAR